MYYREGDELQPGLHFMKKFFGCRRSIIAVFSIACLTYLGVSRGIDVSIAIAGIVAAVSGANSYENSTAIKHTGRKEVDNVG